MIVYYPTYNEFLALVEASSSTTCPLIAIFHPYWKRNSRNDQNSLNSFIQSALKHAKEVYLVNIYGSDEAAEYLIEKLGMSSLPVLAIYKRAQIAICKSISEIDYDFDAQLINSLLQQQVNPLRTVVEPASLLTSIVRGNVGPLKIYIAGDKSKVGKSSVCLGLLSELLKHGFHSSDLAYIKPVTQCEAEQPVAEFCKEHSISYRGIGPVVFYKGFTRAFLNKETESNESLLRQVVESVDEISIGKKIVLVDGVGYPSVGSIINLSNAAVAKALSAPVLLVGKSGVGDAVDSYNLNATYFASHGVKVLGGVFNKFPLEGFYNLGDCKAAITSYFDQYQRDHHLYGFIPEVIISPHDDNRGTSSNSYAGIHSMSSSMINGTTPESRSSDDETSDSLNPFIVKYLAAFHAAFDLSMLIKDIFLSSINMEERLVPFLITHSLSTTPHVFAPRQEVKHIAHRITHREPLLPSTMTIQVGNGHARVSPSMPSARKRSRAEIEIEAASKGAKIG
jgi:dethiobiotin synthetase